MLNINGIKIMNTKIKKAFTLVEMMIVVVIIGLLAAMAIPAFQKAGENAARKALHNDARQIAWAAERYMLESSVTVVTNVDFAPDGALAVACPLYDYVKKVGKNTVGPSTMNMDEDFTMSHPRVDDGAAVIFSSVGQVK